MIIRPENSEDKIAVRRVNELAFGRPQEANLVESLHAAHKVILSLVAMQNEKIIGHILFSPVSIKTDLQAHEAVGLGPIAVLPEFQKQGVGSALVRRSLEMLRQQNHELVVVLGHPEYYPRFGFAPASSFGINSPFDVPDECFMLAELTPEAAKGKSGTVMYPSEFDEV